MKKVDISHLLDRHRQLTCLYSLLIIVILFALFFRLGSLIGGYSSSEVLSFYASRSLRIILNNPINAPYQVIGRMVMVFHSSHSLLIMRVVSTVIGILTIGVFCLLLARWHNNRTAIIGSLLFGTSSWFLHMSRLGTPEVLSFLFFVLYASAIWLKINPKAYVLFLWILLSTLLIYVPGMIWLIGLLVVINWKNLDNLLKKNFKVVVYGSISVVIILSPLVWAIFKKPRVLKVLLGLPAKGWPTVTTLIHNFFDVPVRIFIYGRANPVTWLDHLPLLNIFETVMFAFGLYVYLKHANSSRSKQMLAIFIVGSAVIALGGFASLSLLVPFVFLILSAGIEYLLSKWFMVFPRNPIAQQSGIFAVSVVILLTVIYQSRQYFVAWPLNNATKAVYTNIEPRNLYSVSGTIKE